MNRKDLKSYKYTQEWIKGRIEQIEEDKSIINKLTATLTSEPKGSKKIYDSEAEKIVKLSCMIDNLLCKILEERKKQDKILEQLNKIEQPYKIILDKIYIQGKSLVTVASEMDYDYKHMCYKNGVALNKFDELDK